MATLNWKPKLLQKISSTLIIATCVLGLAACGQTDNYANKLRKVEKQNEALQTTKSTLITVNDAYQIAVEGDYDGALTAIESILKKEPHNIAALKIRAECNFAKKQYSLAIADLDEVLRSDPSRGSYFLRAQVYQSSNQHELAQADYEKVVALDLKQVRSMSDQAPPLKTRIIHLIYLANSLERQTKWDKAVALYSQILAMEKDDQASIHGRARDLVKLGKNGAALLDLNHLIQLNPRDGGLRLERAECLSKLGKAADARIDLLQAKTFDKIHGGPLEKLEAKQK